MSKPKYAEEMVGRRFDRWTVLARVANNPRGHTRWLCRCDCGTEKEVLADSLRSGKSKSCGCLLGEILAERNAALSTHGFTRGEKRDPVYVAWTGMKSRCAEASLVWRNYGARGITVCPEWVESFEAFYAHVGDHPGPEYSLDRIDNDRGYEPGNVRWATAEEQARNRRRATHCGKDHEFTPENTGINWRGHRYCITCETEGRKARYAAKKEGN